MNKTQILSVQIKGFSGILWVATKIVWQSLFDLFEVFYFNIIPELKTLEWDILNPDQLINLRIITREERALFNLDIKKKRISNIDLDIQHSKVFSSG